MKKIYNGLIAFILIFIVSSCRKDRTCTCVKIDGTGNFVEVYEKAWKKQAEDACASVANTYKSWYTECTLD